MRRFALRLWGKFPAGVKVRFFQLDGLPDLIAEQARFLAVHHEPPCGGAGSSRGARWCHVGVGGDEIRRSPQARYRGKDDPENR